MSAASQNPPPIEGDENGPLRVIGDYRLRECLSEDGEKIKWLAEQVSIGRAVIVDELKDLSDQSRALFFSDTRARAGVDHPYIASVYEAVDAEGHCIRASERLTGETLQAMQDVQSTIEPARMARVLRCIAEASIHHETHGRATKPVALEHIHVDPGGVTRLANLARTGHREEGESERDVTHLGRELVPLVAVGCPGTTRMLTVLAWMRGKDRPAPLQWLEVIELCDEIDRQLSEPVNAVLAESKSLRPLPDKRGIMMLSGFTIAAIVVITLIAWLMRTGKQEPIDVARPAPVLIPAGEYPTPGGGMEFRPAFLIDARETTIREYHEFLETLAVLAEADRHRAFDHREQPPEKSGHKPQEWEAMFAAARNRGEWKGKALTLDSPVFGVDWWDAVAYANWRKARLPSLEEWYAALHHECEDPSEIPSAPWRAFASGDCADRTPTGIFAMAGSLSEWTADLSISPANPLGSPQHVIVGGSYTQPTRNALNREWTPDPGLRRPDLGFRLVRDAPEEP